ncbi:AraC family transcriptional regulator [Fictibacillus phosphorivorans]|uniref:AraC family transcriptional regulator n=1 Tax=Fictibacillus phosphorivorans TaxID=1221500 RepID=UPI00203B3331|nr:AraC family transcriptional regulator [Fictibacillus phosphorivorans]MCM3718974.1 AraC family transcriptional regulator [Fictibacillus phosphorivorans]MCM3776596.1 AraC family transcriptional regulator [Fictibacillus phosphorivorans]
MDYKVSIQRTLDYIEENLHERITLEELAELACFSPFHYHRVFHFVVGESVMDYVRKRRLTQAAIRLIESDEKVIDIALDLGFQYQESFNRAFKKNFGVSPRQYRNATFIPKSLHQKAYLSRSSFTGGISMEMKLVTKPAFNLIGYELKTRNVDGENNREVPKFWQHYLQNNLGAKIPSPLNKNELGLCTDYNMTTGEFVYIIGMEVEEGTPVPEGLVYRGFPKKEYAVFTTPKATEENFPSSIQSTWVEIYSKWFPSSEYEQEGSLEFELYDERCLGKEKQIDIYIPVIKRTVKA